jgi:hypothetical protein
MPRQTNALCCGWSLNKTKAMVAGAMHPKRERLFKRLKLFWRFIRPIGGVHPTTQVKPGSRIMTQKT